MKPNTTKIYDWGDLPNPGSEKAIELGCTCAVIDNRYGKGIPSENGKPNFWITGECPLHDPKANEEHKIHD